ncbi:MAG: hypothetical protein K2O93_03055 [Oscillospiraceae bacterium]|nr:hypothetical protein [Oscillospiraceae bacterium]
MSKQQKRFAFLGAFIGLIYLGRELLSLPEFFTCFCVGAAFAMFLLNIFLTEENMLKLCAWKKRVLARLAGRG